MVLQIERVSKSFPKKKAGDSVLVLQDVTFNLREGEMVALMGANGSGKSTLLRLIAGLDSCSGGRIIKTGDREGSVELMFQDFRATLLSWFTAEHNALGLPVSTSDEQAMARELLVSFMPSLNGTKYFSQMSGGEQQAIALIRSLARKASFLLLDEPFTSLDLAVRKRAYAACRRAVSQRRVQALLIATHNIEDAVTLADRVIILAGKPGRISCEVELPQYETRLQVGLFGGLIEQVRGRLNDALDAEKMAK